MCWFSVTCYTVIHDYSQHFLPKVFHDHFTSCNFFSAVNLHNMYKFILYTPALDYILFFVLIKFMWIQSPSFNFNNRNIFMVYKLVLYSIFYLIYKLIEGRHFAYIPFVFSIVLSIGWSHAGYLISSRLIQSFIHSYLSDLWTSETLTIQQTTNSTYIPRDSNLEVHKNKQVQFVTDQFAEIEEDLFTGVSFGKSGTLSYLSLCTPSSSTVPGK